MTLFEAERALARLSTTSRRVFSSGSREVGTRRIVRVGLAAATIGCVSLLLVDARSPGVRVRKLDGFLSSDRTPDDCMQLSDLDGFLTALAIGALTTYFLLRSSEAGPRPTSVAYFVMRSATSSGCSMKLVVESSTPGMMTLPAGSFTRSNTRHSCAWRGLAASNEMPAGFAANTTSMMSASGTS